MGERGRHHPAYLNLTYPVGAGAGVEGVLFDEPQRIRDGARWALSIVAAARPVGDRPQRRHALHRGKGQVIAGDRLGPRPGVCWRSRRQLPRIGWRPAVPGGEELPADLGADPGPDPRPAPPSPRAPRRPHSRRRSFCHLDPERRHVRLVDLERRPEPGHRLVVPHGQVRALRSCRCRCSARGCSPPRTGLHLFAVTTSPG